jgi:cytochrome c553
MKKRVLIGLLLLATDGVAAAEKSAEQLVAGKEKADITYRQLMEVMGTASDMINGGIVRENPQMVKKGVYLIVSHPAPNHKPWLIVPPGDQEEFKKTLVAYDPILDAQADQIAVAAERRDWVAATGAASTLMGTCVSCHAGWKAKAVNTMK